MLLNGIKWHSLCLFMQEPAAVIPICSLCLRADKKTKPNAADEDAMLCCVDCGRCGQLLGHLLSFCYMPQWGCVITFVLFVCPSVCEQDYAKSSPAILTTPCKIMCYCYEKNASHHMGLILLKLDTYEPFWMSVMLESPPSECQWSYLFANFSWFLP